MTGNVPLSVRKFIQACLSIALALLAAVRLEAGDNPQGEIASPPHRDEIWTISSRQVAFDDERSPRLSYWQYCHQTGQWTPSSHEAFLASDDPALPNCFFVHGNRVNHDEAFQIGWRAYERIRSQAPPRRRFRFVIWTWPSTQIPGLLKDLRLKAQRAEAHAYYLAWLLDQMHPQTRVSLVGYSYGARLIASSLHLLGGGRSAGRALVSRLHPDRRPVRAVLMAGALDNNALLPHARNGLALTQVDRMLVLTNPADEVLKYYRLLYGLGSKVQALGAAGVAGLQSLANQSKVAHWNVSRLVGSEHDWSRYLYSPAIASRIERHALYAE